MEPSHQGGAPPARQPSRSTDRFPLTLSTIRLTANLSQRAAPSQERLLILGLGTDITEVHRIQASIARFGQHFLDRVYTPGEVAYCQARKKSSAQSFAARFAAKEAAAKALGTGISRGVTWREFEVVRHPGQAPQMMLHGRAAEIAAHRGIRRLTLSLTHTNATAMAVVVAEDS